MSIPDSIPEITLTTLIPHDMLSSEIWKDVKWYKWLYQVSNLWNIASLNYKWKWERKVLKKIINSRGYESVNLSYNWVVKINLVHRLVAQSFIQNTKNKPQVNHINGDKTLNVVSNLEWCTAAENNKHAYEYLWKKSASLWKFWKDSFQHKEVYQFNKDGVFIKKWDSIMDVQRELWIFQTNISKCCAWKLKTSWWYKWSFKKH